jgi:putative intracellular protease/amidase
MKKVGVVLFDGFETLDVFGPVEIFGVFKEEYQIFFYSQSGGIVKNYHGVELQSLPLENIIRGIDVLLIPGGFGTRTLVNDAAFIEKICEVATGSEYVLTVCTGSGLLARTGLLDGRRATSNKRALEWAMSMGKNVHWIKKARWTVDGKYYTSSGVSAGMDMVFGFIKDVDGEIFARQIAWQIEYTWQEDKDFDPFSGKPA